MSRRVRVAVLGEKPQGARWLTYLLESGRFEIVAGVPRMSEKNVWWDGEAFASTLRSAGVPVVERTDLADIDYDIIWSLMYGFIIEGPLIEKALVGLNLHEAPMPRYRGCNGYSHCIFEGAETYGTTFHVLDAELDNGELIDQEIFRVRPGETAKELYARTEYVSDLVFKRNIEGVADGSITSKQLDTSHEPVRQRSSLLELKPIPPDELDDLDVLSRRARALDFLPFEPAYLDLDSGRWYVFVNGSLGRLDAAGDLPVCASRSDILTLCERGTPFVVEADLRPLVFMPADAYRACYPVFVPKYSWMTR